MLKDSAKKLFLNLTQFQNIFKVKLAGD
jgi:hypothetical protein